MNKDIQTVVYGSSLLSIVAAVYLFAIGKRDSAIFVALWAPTILGFGAFFNTEVPPSAPAERAEE